MLEHSLGHAAHARNLALAAAGELDLDASLIAIRPRPAGWRDRLPVLGSWSFQASWSAYRQVRSHLAQGPVDALYIHSQVAALLLGSQLRSVPSVISMDATPTNFDSIGEGYRHRKAPEPLERAKAMVNRHAFTAASLLITFSRWAADSLIHDYGVPGNKVRVVRPGVDLSVFRPASGPRREGPPRVLFVGGDFERKGGPDLLEAMARLGDRAELDIVTASESASMPGGLVHRVHRGLSPASDGLAQLYQRADLLVLPSRSECYGHVIVEAFASGLPVVATRVGAIPELVVDGINGRLVPAGHPGKLADAIAELISRPDLRTRMGQAAKALAQGEHDALRNNRRLLAMIKALVERRELAA